MHASHLQVHQAAACTLPSERDCRQRCICLAVIDTAPRGTVVLATSTWLQMLLEGRTTEVQSNCRDMGLDLLHICFSLGKLLTKGLGLLAADAPAGMCTGHKALPCRMQ